MLASGQHGRTRSWDLEASDESSLSEAESENNVFITKRCHRGKGKKLRPGVSTSSFRSTFNLPVASAVKSMLQVKLFASFFFLRTLLDAIFGWVVVFLRLELSRKRIFHCVVIQFELSLTFRECNEFLSRGRVWMEQALALAGCQRFSLPFHFQL